MNAKSVIQLLEYIDPLLCLITIGALFRAKQVRAFFSLFLLLWIEQRAAEYGDDQRCHDHDQGPDHTRLPAPAARGVRPER